MIPGMHSAFASVYNDLLNYDKAADHCKKGLSILDAKGYIKPETRTGLYFQLSYAYLYLKKADSALHYAQLANAYWIKTKNTEQTKWSSTIIADAYAMMGSHKLAEGYYQNSIDLDKPGKSFGDAIAAGHYSRYLLKLNNIQEAKYFGIRGLTAAISAQAKLALLENVSILKKVYEAAHQPDSAYYYANLELAYRDSLFNQQRVNAIQDMAFKEQVRQQEEALKKAEEDLQRKHNLQYAAIALGVVTFVILFFMLSHSIIANQRLIRFLGILALLIVFEFLNLLLHPLLDKITNHQPVLMLLAMVSIAALLIPLHHKLEHWITHKMVEKNKKIRLAAAKKTLAELERENNKQ
jgi:predicted Holliday junction resolvase-like endonuclease